MYDKKCQGPFRASTSIALASGSPRRRQLLTSLGVSFVVCSVDVQELDGDSGLSPDKLTLENAMLKLNEARKVCNTNVLICADTCVYCDRKIFGKPLNFDDAFNMLSFLSGKWHEVFTSFVIYKEEQALLRERTICSKVYLDVINPKVLHAYCSSKEPYDKAGGYAIQGVGAFMVQKIEGSYTNVVGLPVTEVVKELLDIGAIEPCASV